MKKYLPLLIAVLFIYAGCSKKADKVDPIPVVPEISIQNISYPTFTNSSWNQVIGGKLVLEFDLKDAKDSIASRTKDSIDLKDIAGYKKTLEKGKYDINIASGNPAAVADTFLRFNGKVTSYTVDNKQAVDLTVTTNDGLITIDQNFIQDNTVPTFKSDSAPTVYKLGLSNGFYYLYIKGGVKGSISFVSKATGQQVAKPLNIATLNQYNMTVVTNKGSLQVVFGPFTYNHVAVVSSTLITLNVIPDGYVGYTTYFVATDETGKIIADSKYVPGTTKIKFSTSQPFTKDRFNFFEIKVPADVNTVPDITGYLQVKKGSVYVNTKSYTSQTLSTLKVHLKNAAGFDNLSLSTDITGISINAPADSTSLPQFNYSSKSNLWVQMLKNNTVLYNFFTIPAGTTNYNLDLAKVTKPAKVKSVTAPGNNFGMYVNAKLDKSSFNGYYFGPTNSQTNQLNYYYPSETFPEYDTFMGYFIGNFNYVIKNVGTEIPDHAAAFNASFNVAGTSLANFKPTTSGTFDYYFANFLDLTSSHHLQVNLFSPSAANYTTVKLPNFSKYLGITQASLSALLLKQFGLYQTDGFNEAKFYYDSPNSDSALNSKSVVQNYNK